MIRPLQYLLIAGGIAIGLGAAVQPGYAQTITVPVPAELQVPAGHVAFLRAQATGTQNYICLPSGTGFAWRFVAPQATLFVAFPWVQGELRQQVTTHFLSPNPMEGGTARATWQSSFDTSSVWARAIVTSTDPNYVAQGAIPWLLLEVVGTQRGPAGGGALAQATYLHRVNTTGGLAPASGCTQAGTTVFVPYTTDYVFYKANGN